MRPRPTFLFCVAAGLLGSQQVQPRRTGIAASATESATTLASSKNPSRFGEQIALTAAVTPAAAEGVVTFYEGTTVLGSAPVAGGQATLRTIGLRAGALSLRAYYGGSAAFAPSVSANLAQRVVAEPVTAFVPAGGSPFNTGQQPISVAVADFNGDGRADMAVAAWRFGKLTVLLGAGDGSFQEAGGSPYIVGWNCVAVVTGDFNGDGKPDVAVANQGTDDVTVLLGEGNGGFREARGSRFPIGKYPRSIAVGDFNSDGKADLAVGYVSGIGVTVLLGDGSGGFSEASRSPFATHGSYSVAVGDFNGDGQADLAAAGKGVTILLGDGLGGFAEAQGSPAARDIEVGWVAVADFNGDETTDLVFGHRYANQVAVLLGSGKGDFTEASGSPFEAATAERIWGWQFQEGSRATPVAVADFNADGAADVAVAGESTVTMLMGNGRGGLVPTHVGLHLVHTQAKGLAAGDFNGDGRTDLATAPYIQDSVSVFLGVAPPAASVTLEAAPAPSIFGQPVKLTATVAPAAATGPVSFYDGVTLLGSAPLVAGQAVLNVTDLPAGARALEARFGDDAAYARHASPVVAHRVNAVPSARFVESTGGPIDGGRQPGRSVAGDFNGDGNADLAIVDLYSDGITVQLGNGRGGFTKARGSPFKAGRYERGIAVGDFNGDGKADLAVTDSGSTYRWSPGSVSVFLGDGNGGFTAARGSPLAWEGHPSQILVVDVNGDGKADLVAADAQLVRCYEGAGDGSFVLRSSLGMAGKETDSIFLAAGDFNGDRKPDFAFATFSSMSASIFLGTGRFGFKAATGSPIPLYAHPFGLEAGDFNADGRIDLVVRNYDNGYMRLLLANHDGSFSEAPSSPVMVEDQGLSMVAGDFNGDGKLDLAVPLGRTSAVAIMWGNGVGWFTPATGSPYAVGARPLFVTVADFNGDGRADLAVSTDRDVRVLLGVAGALPSVLSATTLTANPSPSLAGQEVTLTASVTPAGAAGSVRFIGGSGAGAYVIGSAPLISGRAAIKTSTLKSGRIPLRADYGGDATHHASSSEALNQVVYAVPRIDSGEVRNAADRNRTSAPGAWMTIHGSDLAPATRYWAPEDFSGNNLPTRLDGVSVTIDGRPAYLNFISPTDLTVLVPSGTKVGSATVQVTTATGGKSNEAEALLDWAAPALFTSYTASGKFATGFRPGGLSLAVTGAKPGETVMLLGTGFGDTSPPTPIGQVVPATPLARAVTARIGGQAAVVRWAGLVAPGLYQFNVVVPEAPDGVHKVVLEMAGKTTQPDVLLRVGR